MLKLTITRNTRLDKDFSEGPSALEDHPTLPRRFLAKECFSYSDEEIDF